MKTGTAESYQARIERVLAHVRHHLDDPCGLDELAGMAGFSPFHFHRVFRGMVGESVKEHVRRLRLERAAHRLRTSKAPVVEIALEAGYETHESFTRAFAGVFRMPPSEFRKREAVAVAPAVPALHGSASDYRIARLEPLRALYVTHFGPYSAVGPAWSRLMQWVGMRGLLGPRPRIFGIVHDDPEVTPPEKLRYDAAIAVDRPVSPSGDIALQEIPGGDYAVALHIGPYSRIFDSYADLCGRWLPCKGRELRGAPALEFYLNSPGDTPPEQLRTELWLPLVEE